MPQTNAQILGISKKQLSNYEAMIPIMRAVKKPRFDMSSYFATRQQGYWDDSRGEMHELKQIVKGKFDCPYTACAVGHAALNNIGVKPKREGPNSLEIDWNEYVSKTFGISVFSNVFDYLFDAYWADYNDTPKRVAKRLEQVVEWLRQPESDFPFTPAWKL